jgi:hypothetical protein
MKTKIAHLLFTTVLLLALNFGTDIGGPTVPPQPPTGPAFKSSASDGISVNSKQSILLDVAQNNITNGN